jgi:hypothetical protein
LTRRRSRGLHPLNLKSLTNHGLSWIESGSLFESQINLHQNLINSAKPASNCSMLWIAWTGLIAGFRRGSSKRCPPGENQGEMRRSAQRQRMPVTKPVSPVRPAGDRRSLKDAASALGVSYWTAPHSYQKAFLKSLMAAEEIGAAA